MDDPDPDHRLTVQFCPRCPMRFESRGVRVLVVDDYRPFANLLAAVLWNQGYEVRAAYSAEQAFSTAKTFTPDALVLDVLLPESNGFEVAEEWEQRFPACRVLLTSACDFQGEPGKAPRRFK